MKWQIGATAYAGTAGKGLARLMEAGEDTTVLGSLA
jgi:hypothetical protein